ncbi:MAG: HNH endonuclease [Planctomycetota bacterium]
MTRVVDQPVLVLNRNWQPVAVLSVGVAVTTVIREMGWVVDPETFQLLEFEAWCALDREGMRRIRTPRGSVPAPDVIVLREFASQPSRSVGFSRRNLLRRDQATCQYCGVRQGGELTIDHVVPRSRGGATSWENCVLACGRCNHRKADRTPREAGMPLRRAPERPRWQPTFAVPRAEIRESWAPFLAKGEVQVEMR